MYPLSWLIDNMEEGQIARADFADDEHWYVIKLYDSIWYCDERGNVAQHKSELVPLTFSNMRAWYEIVGQNVNYFKE